MNLFKLLLLIVVPYCISVSGCTKQDESSTLTSKAWKRAKTDRNPSNIKDVLNDLPYPTELPVLYSPYPSTNCGMGALTTFSTDGIYHYQAGTAACSNEVIEKTGTYTLDEINKKIIIDGTTYTYFGISKGQLKYGGPLPSGTGYSYLIYIYE